MNEEKLVIIKQPDPSEPIQVEMTGDWKAKEIPRIQRAVILAYRRHKAALRKSMLENKKED